jgi:hypothetical protein
MATQPENNDSRYLSWIIIFILNYNKNYENHVFSIDKIPFVQWRLSLKITIQGIYLGKFLS